MRFILSILMLAIVVRSSWQYCYMKVLTDDATECTLKDGTKIPLGETLKQPSLCEECSCHANSGPNGEVTMGCCGYGIHAGVMMAAPGCKIIADTDGCTPKMVHVDDESKLC